MKHLKTAVLVFLLLWTVPAMAVDEEQKSALLKSAMGGDAKAQYALALIYQEEAIDGGDDMFEPDPELWKKMVHWCEAASAQGHLGAKKTLLMLGYDPASSGEDEAKWFKLANEMAEGGNKYAQYRLAEINFAKTFSSRLHFAEPVELAIFWYSKLLEGRPAGETMILSKIETFHRDVTVDYVKQKLKYLENLLNE